MIDEKELIVSIKSVGGIKALKYFMTFIILFFTASSISM